MKQYAEHTESITVAADLHERDVAPPVRQIFPEVGHAPLASTPPDPSCMHAHTHVVSTCTIHDVRASVRICH